VALLQATGRVSIHDNLFIGASPGFAALVVTAHQGKSVALGYVYNNTVFGGGTGIAFSEMASEDDGVVGNLVFAGTPISGPIADTRDNLVGAEADAAGFVNNPVAMLGAMDFYPLPGAAEGTPLDLAKFAGDGAWDRDFNGASKGTLTFRGAYAGAGENPCGPLDDQIDDCGGGDDGGGSSDDGGGSDATAGDGGSEGAGSGGDGGASDGATTSAVDDTGGGTAGSGAADDEDGGGCGCSSGGTGWSAMIGLVVLAGRRRRR
jgi:MYXO-CTERM domain-containing protein